MVTTYIKLSAFIVMVGLFLAGFSANAQTSPLPGNGDPNYIVCHALAKLLPCTPPTAIVAGATTTTTTTSGGTTYATVSSTAGSSSLLGRLFGFSDSGVTTRSLSANISQGFQGTTEKNLAVVLVQVPGSSEVYRLIGGKKFLVPNAKVFESYGYIVADISPISQEKLDLYPRVKLVKFDGDTDVYYLTEKGLTRKVLNETVFNSYADRGQDVVIINKTEFSFYPQNTYIFNESVQVVNRSPNVYLVGDGTKKLVFPDELFRLGVIDDMIAPVNQIEFDAYQNILFETPKQKLWYNIF